MTTEPVKEPAKEPVKQPVKKASAPKADSYTAFADKLPPFKYKGTVNEQSGILLFKNNKGKVFAGRVTRYTVDITAHHVDAKKGDLVFVDAETGSTLGDIVSWKPIDK